MVLYSEYASGAHGFGHFMGNGLDLYRYDVESPANNPMNGQGLATGKPGNIVISHNNWEQKGNSVL